MKTRFWPASDFTVNQRILSCGVLKVSCQKAVTILLLTAAVNAKADQSGLPSEIIETHKLRSATYDNGHYLWVRSEEIDGSIHEKRYEYWARDGEYLRLDEERRVDDERSGPPTSIFVRPEGFVKLKNRGIPDGSVATDFGPAAEGFAKIRNQYVFKRESKIGVSEVANWIRRSREPSGSVTNFKLVEEPDDRLKITFSSDVPQGTRRYEGILSRKDFRVLVWRYKFNGAEGSEFEGQFGETEARYEYDEPAKLVPVKQLESSRTNDGDSTRQWDLVEYDFTPASIGVFEIPSGALVASRRSSPWTRRLIIFLIGFTLIALYFVLRKRTGAEQTGIDN